MPQRSSDLVGASSSESTTVENQNVLGVLGDLQSPGVSTTVGGSESGPWADTVVLVDEEVIVRSGADDDCSVGASDVGVHVVRGRRRSETGSVLEWLTGDLAEFGRVTGDLEVNSKVHWRVSFVAWCLDTCRMPTHLQGRRSPRKT